MCTLAVLYGLRLMRILAVVGRFGRGLTAKPGAQRLVVDVPSALPTRGPAGSRWRAAWGHL